MDDLLAILSGQKRVIPMPNLSARCTLSMNPDSEIKEAMVGCLRIDNPNGNLHLLGTPLSVGPVRFFFTNTRIAPATRFLDGKQMLELKGTNSTQRWFQKY